MQIKTGTRLKSAVCETQVIAVRAPATDVEITCGGAPMLAMDDEAPDGVSLQPGEDEATLLGKRYASEEVGIELLCTKSGQGSLALNGVRLHLKETKPLPSSD